MAKPSERLLMKMKRTVPKHTAVQEIMLNSIEQEMARKAGSLRTDYLKKLDYV